MSHCKFEHPRHGHLGFLPRKRSRQIRGRARSFPKTTRRRSPHLTSFMVYKAGMTHIVRDVDRPGSKVNKKEVVEPVTILEAPPMVVVGMWATARLRWGTRRLEPCGRTTQAWSFAGASTRTGNSLRSLPSQSANSLPARRRGALLRVACSGRSPRRLTSSALWHTRSCGKLRNNRVGVKRAHVSEIQINGGTVQQKIELAKSLLEKEIRIDSVFQQSEACDVCAVTKVMASPVL
ncbi:putative Ribosomal protein L3 [Trypanosoma vivax]|nr:putative Ribosomal protein L3 [Trypanosoma vivax]